jgi:hypothetical protein
MNALSVRPFANGFEWDNWQAANCEQCPIAYDPETMRDYACPIQAALDWASSSDGTIAGEIAKRMGFSDAVKARLGWPCKERLLVERGGGTLPVDEQMRRAGAMMLPGLEI